MKISEIVKGLNARGYEVGFEQTNTFGKFETWQGYLYKLGEVGRCPHHCAHGSTIKKCIVALGNKLDEAEGSLELY